MVSKQESKHTVGKDRNVQLSTRLNDAILQRLSTPQRELNFNSLNLGDLGGAADGGGADLAQGDATDIAVLDVLGDGGDGGLDLNGAVLAGGLKHVDAALAADEPYVVLDAAVHAVGRGVEGKGGEDAALAVEVDLGDVFGVLFVVAGEYGEGVVVGGTVDLGGVEGVAPDGDGFLEQREDLVVGELGRAPSEAWGIGGVGGVSGHVWMGVGGIPMRPKPMLPTSLP